MLNVYRYHIFLIGTLGGIILLGSFVSFLFKLNHFNLSLSQIRATDYLAFKNLERTAPSVWADRRNWMNVWFVKLAWFWNTLCILLISFTLKRTGGGLRGEMGKVSVPARLHSWHDVLASKTFLRWIIPTLGWFGLTQWMLGAPLLERLHIATGAACYANSVSVDESLCRTRAPISTTSHPILYEQFHPALQEHAGPIRAGWHGGFDVSGHTFVLVLSILLLAEMIIPYIPSWMTCHAIPSHLQSHRRVFASGSALTRLLNAVALVSTMTLLALWCSMLFSTSLYYHTALEKLGGYLFALLVWVCMPRESVHLT